MKLRIPTRLVLCTIVLSSLALSSCKKTPPAPPPLDRDSFIAETSMKLPPEGQILDSKSSVWPDGISTSLVLKLPKSAAGMFPGSPTIGDGKIRTNTDIRVHQMDMDTLAKAGIHLREPNGETRSYRLTSKTRGDGFATVYSDGDHVFALCSFNLPR